MNDEADGQAEGLLETARVTAAEMVIETEAARVKAADIVIERAEIRAANLVLNQVMPRVNGLQNKLNVLAAFVLIGLILVSALLQRQATQFENDLQELCVQHAVSDANRNAAWSTLASHTQDPVQAKIYLAAVTPTVPC